MHPASVHGISELQARIMRRVQCPEISPVPLLQYRSLDFKRPDLLLQNDLGWELARQSQVSIASPVFLSGKEFVHYIAVDICQTEVTAIVAEGEPLVI